MRTSDYHNDFDSEYTSGVSDNLTSVTLDIEFEGETFQAEITYVRWDIHNTNGNNCTFEIYRIDCDVDLPESIVHAELADYLSTVFPDTI